MAIGTIRNGLSAVLQIREKLGDHLPLIPKRFRSMLFKGLEWMHTPDGDSTNPMLPHKAAEMNR